MCMHPASSTFDPRIFLSQATHLLRVCGDALKGAGRFDNIVVPA